MRPFENSLSLSDRIYFLPVYRAAAAFIPVRLNPSVEDRTHTEPHPLGCIDDPDAIVLPGRLVYPGDQQFEIGVADPQQRVNPEVFRAGKLLSVNADPHCFYASRWTMADFPV